MMLQSPAIQFGAKWSFSGKDIDVNNMEASILQRAKAQSLPIATIAFNNSNPADGTLTCMVATGKRDARRLNRISNSMAGEVPAFLLFLNFYDMAVAPKRYLKGLTDWASHWLHWDPKSQDFYQECKNTNLSTAKMVEALTTNTLDIATGTIQ